MPPLASASFSAPKSKLTPLPGEAHLTRRGSDSELSIHRDRFDSRPAQKRRLSDTSQIAPEAHKKFLEIFDDFCPLTQSSIKELNQGTLCLADRHIYDRENFRRLIMFQGPGGRSPLLPTRSLAHDARLLGLLPLLRPSDRPSIYMELVAPFRNIFMRYSGLNEDQLSERIGIAIQQSVSSLRETPDLSRRFFASVSSFISPEPDDENTLEISVEPLWTMIDIIRRADPAVRQPWYDLATAFAPQWPRAIFQLCGDLMLAACTLPTSSLSRHRSASSQLLPIRLFGALMDIREGDIGMLGLSLENMARDAACIPRLTPEILRFSNAFEQLEWAEHAPLIRQTQASVKECYLSLVCLQRHAYLSSMVMDFSWNMLASIPAPAMLQEVRTQKTWASWLAPLSFSLYLLVNVWQQQAIFKKARELRELSPALRQHDAGIARGRFQRTAMKIMRDPYLIPLLGIAQVALVTASFFSPNISPQSTSDAG